jgi:hypothetical protein
LEPSETHEIQFVVDAEDTLRRRLVISQGTIEQHEISIFGNNRARAVAFVPIGGASCPVCLPSYF